MNPYQNQNQPPRFGGPGPYPETNLPLRPASIDAGGPGGWEYVNGRWQPRQRPETPAPPPPKRGGALKAVSLALACGLLGFGGGAAAVYLKDAGGAAVVYRAVQTEEVETGQLSAGGLSVADVAAAAKQSVVSIVTENVVSDFGMGGRIVSGAGSGVILTEDGYILTNCHVVEGARSIQVYLPDGTEAEAAVIGADALSDIAVLKVDAAGLVPAVLGDSAALAVGEFCLAVGNPTGELGGTVTDGIISALDREVTIEQSSMTLLQMSAAVSPGNSGGGLFNAGGELIGIVNAKGDGNGVEGLGFAIPINTAMQVAEQLMTNGAVTGRPALGVTVLNVTTQQQANEAGVPGAGLYIAQVNPGGGAEKAGLQAGDRLISADGQPLESAADLSGLIAAKAVGDSLEIVLERGGAQHTVTVVLQEAAPSA